MESLLGGVMLVGTDRKVARLEVDGKFNFLQASSHELEFLRVCHQELRGIRATSAEISRIRMHIFRLNGGLYLLFKSVILDQRKIKEARREAELKNGKCVDLAAIVIAFEGELEADSFCAICRGVFGITCDGPSIIRHDCCSCRGLQIYGKECIQRVFDYGTRCPNCRGDLKDDVLMEQAKIATKAEFDAQLALLLERLQLISLRLLEKLKTVKNQMGVLRFEKKTYLKLEKAKRRKMKPTKKRTGTVTVVSSMLAGVTGDVAGQGYHSVDVFSQEYITLMTNIISTKISWERLNAKMIARNVWDHIGSKDYLQLLLQQCEFTMTSIGATLHSNAAKENIGNLSQGVKAILEDLESSDENSEQMLKAIQDLGKMERWKVLAYDSIDLMTERRAMLGSQPASSHLGRSVMSAFRYLHNRAIQVGRSSRRRPLALRAIIYGVKEIVKECCKCSSEGSCQLVWLEQLADNCVQSIASIDGILDSFFTVHGQGGTRFSFFTEKAICAEWENVYLVFRLEDLLLKYRKEKPEGWAEVEANIVDKQGSDSKENQEHLDDDDDEEEEEEEEWPMVHFPMMDAFRDDYD